VLLLAFDARTAARLGQAFESRAVDKRYLAVVRGWPEPAGSIEHSLRRLEDGKDRGDPDSLRQDACTDYRRLACAEVPIPSRHHDTTRVALVELHPRTGRQHQVRRHPSTSHPVLATPRTERARSIAPSRS
jgi:tRNA pseudouridine65 synthase